MTRGLGPGMQRKFTKRKKSKGLLKALTGYLVSNSYMYAPLVDYPPMPKATPESLQPTSVSPLLAVRSSAVTVRPPLEFPRKIK